MGLHMRNIVEHQSTDRDVLEIVEARRRGSGPAECLAQLVVVGVIGQRDVGEEAAGLVLQGPERERGPRGPPWSPRVHTASCSSRAGRAGGPRDAPTAIP